MPRDLLENITQPRDLLADEPRDLLVEDSRPRPVKIPSKLSLLGQTLKSTGQDIINYPKFAGEQYKKAGQSLKELPSYLNEPVPSQYSDVYTPRWHNLIEMYGPIALLFAGGVAGIKDIKTKIQWNKTIDKILKTGDFEGILSKQKVLPKGFEEKLDEILRRSGYFPETMNKAEKFKVGKEITRMTDIAPQAPKQLPAPTVKETALTVQKTQPPMVIKPPVIPPVVPPTIPQGDMITPKPPTEGKVVESRVFNAKLEEPVANAVDIIGENEPTASSGFHTSFTEKDTGINPSWAIVFNGRINEKVRIAAEQSGLKINEREVYKGAKEYFKKEGDENYAYLTDIYLPNVKQSETTEAKEVFDKFAENYSKLSPTEGKVISKNPQLQQAYDNVIAKLPENIRKDIDIKGLRQIEFPEENQGEGGRLERDGKDNHWIFIEKGEANLEDTILHEVVHSYVLKHPEMVEEGYFGMEDAVNKITKQLSQPTEEDAIQIYSKHAEKKIAEFKGEQPKFFAKIKAGAEWKMATGGKRGTKATNAEKALKFISDSLKKQGRTPKISNLSTDEGEFIAISGKVLPKALQPSEYINAVDKIWYNTFGKNLEKGFFNLLEKITPEVIKRNIVEEYKQPRVYTKLVDMLAAERANQAEIVYNLSKKMATYKPVELKNIRQYIESGEYPDTELGKLAQEIEDIFFDLGKQLVQYKILTPQQFGKYAERYYPYYYKIFQKDGSITRWFKKRLDLSYTKHRKDIPEEWRQANQIIEDSPEPIARKMIAEMGDLALQKFFTAISQNPELSSPTQIKDFKQLPKNKKLGALSETFVHPTIVDDLQGMVYVPQLADSITTKMLSLWKMGKVVLNPPTVGRNLLTNVLMADVVGGVPAENPEAWINGITSLLKKDQYYQQLKGQGKIGIELYKAEIEDILNTFKSEKHPLKVALTLLKKGGEFYSKFEEWAKLTIFRKNVEDGMSIEEAAQLAEDAIFNYSKVSPLVRQLRQARAQGPLGSFGVIAASPFITFRAKAIKALSHAAFRRPFSILKYVLLLTTISALSRKKLGVSKEEMTKIQRSMKERGRYGLLLPMQGKNGEYYLLDMTYMLPVFGDFLEFSAKNKRRGFPQAVQSTFGIFGNPLVTIPMQVISNHDFYRDRPIAGQFDNKFIKHLEFIYQQSTPGLVPGGAGWEVFKNQALPQDIMSTVGLRTIPYDEKQQREYKIKRIKRLDFDFNMEKSALIKNKNLTKEQKMAQSKKLLKEYIRQRKEILSE